MTRKEIEREIKREKKRIESLKNKIADIRFDIAATRKAIKFWKSELKKAGKETA